MEFTINCTRVPLPQGTTLYGTPVEVGPAPALQGSVSDHDPSSGELNDGAALNLHRQAVPEREEPVPTTISNKHLVNCKKNTIISSLNTRTLGPLGRLEELSTSAKSHGIDILAVQEHRFYHPDDTLKYHQADPYQFVTSSASKNSVNASVGGVGFLLSPKASNNLLSVESISSRILVIELEGNPKTTVICVYSPHNSSPVGEVEDFYATLKTTVEQVPLHNFLVISGDLNAKLGPDEVNFTYNSSTNRNGELLKDFMDEFNLFSANNTFMKPKGQLWTFEYPSGQRAQIDYLLFRKKWRNSVRDARSYSSFSTVGSDHRIVSAKVKLSLRMSKQSKPHPMKSIDWKEVSSNQTLSQQFALEVFNKFSTLSTDQIDSDNLESVYDSLVKSTEEIAISTLPKKTGRGHVKPSNSTKVVEARSSLKCISQKYHNSPTQSNKIQLIMAKKNLDDAYLDSEVDFINGNIDTLSRQHISKQHHLAWKTIKELAGKNSNSNVRIKGGSAKKRMENWSNHFKSLLGKKAKLPENNTLPSVQISNTLDIDTSPFTINELKTATKHLKSSKAFGPDNIPAIIWKDEHFHNLLLNLCNHTFSTYTCPKLWHQSQIIPMPKKGDLSLVTNYRGIALMSIAAKTYNKMILNRLTPFVEPLLRKNQNGFRRGRSTLSQILCLRRIIEESQAFNRDLALVFVDFSKAFDSVDREKLFEILGLYGIPTKIIDAIKVLYTDTLSTILTPDGETQPFTILAGILQGDTLAPFLFILVVDYVLRTSVDTIHTKGYELKPRQSSRHPAVHLTDTDFADDIALISQSLENAQSLLQSLEQASNCVGLYLNETKTQYVNKCSSNTEHGIRTLNQTPLKQVDDYKYLGSYISSTLKDFNTRKGMAWSACNDLHKIWASQLSNNIKLKIFKSTVEPILLYGSETWTLSKKIERRLDGTYTRLLMRAQHISWKRHPTKQQIYGNLPSVSSIVKARRIQFAGHCFRAENEIISSLLLWTPSNQSRSRTLSYADIIARDANIDRQDLETVMRDRDVWRKRVNSIISTAVE